MGENSKISWTHHTWSPWWGCARVSPGCEHCYAETFAKRTGHKVWGRTAERRFLADPFRALLKMQAKAERAGERHRVFIASMADIFEAHPIDETRTRQDAIRAALWALTPSLTALDLLLLTKRPENVASMVPAAWMAGAWPSNAWMLTTCEDQPRADERIPHLLRLPAPVRGVSYEPALGLIDFDKGRCDVHDRQFIGHNHPEFLEFCTECAANGWTGELTYGHWLKDDGISWVVVGGESGGGARPFDVEWARMTVRQCRDAGVACFVKQMGAKPQRAIHVQHELTIQPLKLRDAKGGDMAEWPEDLRVREYPEVGR